MPEENNINRWMEVAKWRGESLSAIKALNKEIKALRLDVSNIENKIDKLNDKISNTNIRVAGIAGTISIIVALITAFIIHGIG